MTCNLSSFEKFFPLLFLFPLSVNSVYAFKELQLLPYLWRDFIMTIILCITLSLSLIHTRTNTQHIWRLHMVHVLTFSTSVRCCEITANLLRIFFSRSSVAWDTSESASSLAVVTPWCLTVGVNFQLMLCV